MIEIEYQKYTEFLTIKKEEGKTFIYSPVRKKYLVLGPEEIVRQLVIQYLVKEKGLPLSRMAEERMLVVNNLKKRWDILVYDKNGNPEILVECKAPEVKIDQSTFEQIAHYNLALKVPYLMVTNGIKTYFCEIDFEKKDFVFLERVK